ncbi:MULTISPECIES: hypothetical protein [unclassified Cobetia]|uniref:hypothetical protein n=1 Tax=Pseudomonadota TaxID=1224 RepID=UPI0024496A25|nr:MULTISPECIES: hypothetical protein [unclassified Cobetia]MDH2289973.1 hypothetical protein [Cobetia sp. 10Alg 146]MDH2296013.1 hypothetical protein [Cobetia sp. 1AS1]
MPAIVLKILTSMATTLLTERFLLNLLIVLAERLAKSTSNTLDDQIVRELKRAVEGSKPTLYSEVKK